MTKIIFFDKEVDSTERANKLTRLNRRYKDTVVYEGREYKVIKEGYEKRYSKFQRFRRALQANVEVVLTLGFGLLSSRFRSHVRALYNQPGERIVIAVKKPSDKEAEITEGFRKVTGRQRAIGDKDTSRGKGEPVEHRRPMFVDGAEMERRGTEDALARATMTDDLRKILVEMPFLRRVYREGKLNEAQVHEYQLLEQKLEHLGEGEAGRIILHLASTKATIEDLEQVFVLRELSKIGKLNEAQIHEWRNLAEELLLLEQGCDFINDLWARGFSESSKKPITLWDARHQLEAIRSKFMTVKKVGGELMPVNRVRLALIPEATWEKFETMQRKVKEWMYEEPDWVFDNPTTDIVEKLVEEERKALEEGVILVDDLWRRAFSERSMRISELERELKEVERIFARPEEDFRIRPHLIPSDTSEKIERMRQLIEIAKRNRRDDPTIAEADRLVEG